VGLWDRIQEKFWTGPVVKDYGVLSYGPVGRQHQTLSIVLAGRRGETLFLKASYRSFGAASVRFIAIDRDAAVRLDAVLHDALRHM
jgi:hypothetical protein